MSARAKKKVTAAEWSAGDRIGKLSQASLRELRMRTIIVGEWNHDVFIEVAEALEDLIDVVSEVSGEPHLVVEELGDAIKKIAEEAASNVDDAEEEIADAKKEVEEQRERILDLEKDHDADMKAVCENLDEMRARAEKAEHDLAEAVRNGHGVDRDAERRFQLQHDEHQAAIRKVRDESWAREKKIAEEARVAKELLDKQAKRIDTLRAQAERAAAAKEPSAVDIHNARVLSATVEERAAAAKEPSAVDAHHARVLSATVEERDAALTRVNALEEELRQAQETLGRIFALRPTRKRVAK